MDVRYINPFIAAVRDVFKTMLQTEVIVGKPFLKKDARVGGDASAIIGFSGDAAGSVVLCFPLVTGVKAASTFAGSEVSASSDDFGDALGELANMVAGQAKSQLEGLSIKISLPSVIVGDNHAVSKSRLKPTLVLPCDTVLGRFAVEVSMVIGESTPDGATVDSSVVGSA